MAHNNCHSAKCKARPRWISNIVESAIGGLRSAARHQAEQADVKLPIETMKVSANRIEDVSSQYEHCTEKLWDRENCGVLRQGNENETIDARTTAILSDEVDGKHWKIARSGVNQHKKYQNFADTQPPKEVRMLTTKTTTQSDTLRTSQEQHNPEHYFCLLVHIVNSHRHGRIDSGTSTKRN